ncbi:MAG TPA: hypothetical protein VK988_05665 [Acidimicrobiales bacterium]|nr:hypothetical protein [Acidimicrobiales bacterium]
MFQRVTDGARRVVFLAEGEARRSNSKMICASAVAIVGALGAVIVRRSDIALLTAVASALFLFGILAIFSIGILLLAAGVGTLVVLFRRVTPGGRSVVLPAASGIAMAVGLLVGLVISSQGPIVECLPGGAVGSSVGNWWGGGPSRTSDSSILSPDGVATGTIEVGSARYHYECRNGALVNFEKQGG